MKKDILFIPIILAIIILASCYTGSYVTETPKTYDRHRDSDGKVWMQYPCKSGDIVYYASLKEVVIHLQKNQIECFDSLVFIPKSFNYSNVSHHPSYRVLISYRDIVLAERLGWTTVYMKRYYDVQP